MTAAGECACKVGRLLRSYGIEEFDRELHDAWTAPEDRRSTRELAVELNQLALRRAMVRAGADVVEGDVSARYHQLTGETSTSGTRTQARERLERDGVDVDGLSSAFVSHQTVYRHLTDCLDATLDDPDDDRVSTAADTIHALRNRTRAVTETTVRRLASAGELALDDVDVFVDVKVVCESCGRQRSVDDLFGAGGCPCRRA